MVPVETWRIGAVEISRVLELEMPLLDPFELYPDLTRELLDRHRPWLEPRLLDPASGHMVLSIHSLVVKTPASTILIDTCSGNDKQRPHKARYHMKNWPYLARLAAAGFEPPQIDVVLCTHLHADHVGWNTRLVDGRWVPTFPRARYLFAQREWEHWRKSELRSRYTSDPYYEDSLLPVIESGQAEFVAMDHVLDDYARLEPTPGHTPGHVVVRVRSGGGEAVLAGDIMHTALQCAEPQLSSCFCVDPEHSRRTRRAFLEQHAEGPTLILPAHFPTPTAGRIRAHGASYRFEFAGA